LPREAGQAQIDVCQGRREPLQKQERLAGAADDEVSGWVLGGIDDGLRHLAGLVERP
jgi:hypothetical protein